MDQFRVGDRVRLIGMKTVMEILEIKKGDPPKAARCGWHDGSGRYVKTLCPFISLERVPQPPADSEPAP